MTTKKPDPSVLGSNIQPLDAEALAAAAGSPKEGSTTIDPAIMAAAIAHVQAMQAEGRLQTALQAPPQTKPAHAQDHSRSSRGYSLARRVVRWLQWSSVPICRPTVRSSCRRASWRFSITLCWTCRCVIRIL